MFGAMTRLSTIITLLFLQLASVSFSQTGYLFVKKGIKKKQIYTEGDIIHVKLRNGDRYQGYITLLRNDTIFINGQPVPGTSVKEVLLTPS